MKIHELIQGSPEWLAYRAQHFNASDAPAMMGVSPYKTRAELLREMHTGLAAEVDAGTQKRFDNGHRAEALARPLAEEFIGQELYPVTGSEGRLSASFDGLTLDESQGFEHKALNAELRAAFDAAWQHPDSPKAGRFLPIHHRIQMEQQLLVSGAGRILFVASEWASDDSLVEERHCWYYPDADLRAKIVAGWDQFAADLAAYAPPAQATPAPTGRAPDTLPALRIEISGGVTASNLAEFKQTALAAIGSVNRSLTTDQDFADAEKAVKWCSEVETRLAAAKEHALSQTASIDDLFRTMDDISAEARRVRLDLDKLVKARKEAIRTEIVSEARRAYELHEDVLRAETGGPWIVLTPPDFGGAVKGLRTVDSIRNAVDTTLAAAKIKADDSARRIRESLRILAEDGAGFEFLFPDRLALIGKALDDLRLLVQSRIAAHKDAEAKRMEAERQRIRAEEEAKARREAEDRIAAEQAAQRAIQQAAAPAPAPMETAPIQPVLAPASAPQQAAPAEPLPANWRAPDSQRTDAEVDSFVALVLTAFDCKFPNYPKPSAEWWAKVRTQAQALQREVTQA
jgi:putative phage-type endonuclease